MTLFDGEPLMAEEIVARRVQLELSLDGLDDELATLDETQKVGSSTMQLEFTI